MQFSILLLTLNEETNLPACLEAISWCDDIVVLDSFSTDRTVEIAEKAGARVFQRKFDGFAGQRNHALENIDFKHEWIFHLDADEIMTRALRLEIKQTIGSTTFDAFQVPSKMMLFGRWLRYSGTYPAFQVRLTRHPGFKFKQVGHGQQENINPSGIGTLQQSYFHYSFSKGFGEWFERHNRYSLQDAKESIRHQREHTIDWAGLFASDKTRRRRALKGLSYRLPFRPVFRFIYMFFFRLGFLDGVPGLIYCLLLTIYELTIVLKIIEIKMGDKMRRWEG